MTQSNAFSILFHARQSERETERLTDALATIQKAKEQGSIRNAVYLDAKQTIDRAIESGWRRVQDVYLSIPTDIRRRSIGPAQTANDLYFAGVSGAHSLLALRKKVIAAKAGSDAPFDAFYAAADTFVSDLIGLAETIRAVKATVVKGRAPRSAPPPSNPDQIRGTCPCCFANQAVRGTTMVHHGYERPGEGYQTASCPGIRFKPYERSLDGVEAMIDDLTHRIAKNREALASREQWVRLTTMKRVTRSAEHPTGKALVTVERDAPDWMKVYEAKVQELGQKIEQEEQGLAFYAQKKTDWTLAALRKADGTVMPLTFEG